MRSAPTYARATRIKAPIGHPTCLGPTLAKSYPIDGRGRPECPALIRTERGWITGEGGPAETF